MANKRDNDVAAAQNIITSAQNPELLTAYELDYLARYAEETTPADPNAGLTFDPTDTGKAKVVTITDDYANEVFNAGNYSALTTISGGGRTKSIRITGNTLKNVITSGGGNDTLEGLTGNDKLDAGAGDDSLIGGEGTDTLTGGSGKDTFSSSAGKNIITDYSATDGDVIQLYNITPTKVKVSKQNVVITNSDKSTFTLQNAKGATITAVD